MTRKMHITKKMHITEKMHKKMPIRHTRKQRRSGGGFLDWMMGTRRQPQLPVYGPQPQSFNPQQQSFTPQQQSFNPQQQSSNWYGNPMQSIRQGFNQFSQPMSQGFNQYVGQPISQGYNQYVGQPIRQGFNQFGQSLGQGYDQFRQGMGQGYDQFRQGMSQGYDQFRQGFNQYNPIRYASNVYRNYQSNPALSFQGGKIKRRIMKGGYQDNISVTGLASTAAPFSGPTAQPHQMVGGKTRKGGKKVGKTHRNKK